MQGKKGGKKRQTLFLWSVCYFLIKGGGEKTGGKITPTGKRTGGRKTFPNFFGKKKKKEKWNFESVKGEEGHIDSRENCILGITLERGRKKKRTLTTTIRGGGKIKKKSDQ